MATNNELSKLTSTDEKECDKILNNTIDTLNGVQYEEIARKEISSFIGANSVLIDLLADGELSVRDDSEYEIIIRKKVKHNLSNNEL